MLTNTKVALGGSPQTAQETTMKKQGRFALSTAIALGVPYRCHPHGRQPGDLPVVQSTKLILELAVNLQTARARCPRRCSQSLTR
jgi:hypothetical protein